MLSPRLSSYWINIFTPIPASIARPLVDGLSSEVVVRDPEPARRYGVRPVSYETSVKLALDRTSQGAVETLWSGSLSAVPRGTPSSDKLEDTEGMLVDRRVLRLGAAPESVYAAVARIGGEEGWYAFDWLWELRGILDRIVGGQGKKGDIDLLQSICRNMVGHTFCPMGEAAVNPVLSTLERFPEEYEHYIQHKRSITAS